MYEVIILNLSHFKKFKYFLLDYIGLRIQHQREETRIVLHDGANGDRSSKNNFKKRTSIERSAYEMFDETAIGRIKSNALSGNLS